MAKQLDFGKGKVGTLIIRQAIPLTIAELVHLLYNIVDRIYIGHLPEVGGMALTGIGLTFPIITLVTAFTRLFSSGGGPLYAMARGSQNEERAGRLMGNVLSALLFCGVFLTVFGYLFERPILYLFGASDASYVYAHDYLNIYLIGTVFTMIATGMNVFINAQGYPQTGMKTVLIGAVINLLLDPLFIFQLNMGVKGAAWASIIGQAASAFWVLRFLFDPHNPQRLKREKMKIEFPLLKEIMKVGATGFCFAATSSLTQILCNATLQNYGGDIYVGVMSVLNSVREITSLPSNGVGSGAQPVLSYNYGARKYGRVKEGIRFFTLVNLVYLLLIWAIVFVFPGFFIRLFSEDASLLQEGVPALRLFFFGYAFIALQFSGQQTFQALGKAKQAVFFSLLRKVVIVAPLTVLLPAMGFGVNGVFAAEPISNIIGGTASFVTMWLTLYRKLPDDE
ncbi:MAG: MATE family efflux transporter [Erysipelotrichaceae bacterium]|nr:MATE family efflux transporter [Erysipelotrichaceae bacterium]